MIFHDVLTLDAPRKTAEGFLVASVRAARTGIQEYSGREVDPENKHGFRDKSVVRVYRDESEVFHADSLRSFSVLDVTVDHPPEPVTSRNWREYSVGVTGEEVIRDGEFLRVPLMLKDADAIDEVERGKNQLSVGYDTKLVWESGVTADGLQFDAKQTKIRANHLSIVGLARGGPKLKIGDSAVATKNMMVDGLQVEVTDAAELAINKLLGQVKTLGDAKSALETQVGTLTAQVATKDGEIAALNAKVADAALTPAKLDAAVASRAKVIDAAKRIKSDIVTDGKTEAEIRRAAVAAKLGDAVASPMTDDAINGAFAVLSTGTDPIRDTVRSPQFSVNTTDAEEKAFNDSVADLNAWRNKA